MSLQMLMKIDGVTGDGASNSLQFKDWSECLSWEWAMLSNRTSVGHAGDDKTSLNEISVTKNIGVDSAAIRALFAQGKTIERVCLNIRPVVARRSEKTKYISLTLENVRIKSVVTGGGSEDVSFKEHLTFLFDRVEFEYTRNVAGNHSNPVAASEDYRFGWQVSTDAQWPQESAKH